MTVTETEVKVRARVKFSQIDVETPYVMSFNVKRARGQMSATFSASLRIPIVQLSGGYLGVYPDHGYNYEPGGFTSGDNMVQIWAGDLNYHDPLPMIFTGYVYKINLNPCQVDPSFVIMNISGKDVLSVMENQTFSRRAPVTGETGMWGVITQVTRKREDFIERFPTKVRDNMPRLIAAASLQIGKDQVTGTPGFETSKATSDKLTQGPPVTVVREASSTS